LMRQAQEYEEALALLEQARPVVGDREQVTVLTEYIRRELGYRCLEQAISAFTGKDYAVANAQLACVLDYIPDEPYAQYTAGYFRYAQHDLEQALVFLQKIPAGDPLFVAALKLKAAVYFDQGRFEPAVDCYRGALSLQPDDPVVLAGLGISLMNLERYDQALEYLLRALVLQPEDADLLYSAASVYRDKGMFDEALQKYQDVLRLQPQYSNIHNDLGDIYLQRGEVERAGLEFRQERDARLADAGRWPDDLYVLNSLAYAYAGLGEFKKAEETAQMVLAMQPGSRQAYLTLARVYEKTAQPGRAVVALQKAKSLSGAQRFIDERVALIRRENAFGKVKPLH
jgi:tetratricopeptide (TPR) repeat protein